MKALRHEPAEAPGGGNEKFQRWGLIAVVGAMLAALWIIVIGASTIQQHRLMSDASHDLAQLNRAVAEEVGSMFRSADTGLRTVDLWLQSHPGIDPLSDPHLAALVNEVRRSSGGMMDVRLATREGKLFTVPTLDRRPLMDAGAERSIPAWLRVPMSQRERALYIGEPAYNTVTRRWSLPISWRLEAPASGMVVAVANVELDSLFTLHERLRIKPAGGISLVRTDGVVLSRTPYDPSMIGRNLSDTAMFREQFGTRESGAFFSDGAQTDGTPRIVSYQRLEQYPVIVLVSQGAQDIVAVFERRRLWLLLVMLLLSAVAVVITFALHRSLLGLQHGRREMQRLATSDSLTGVMSRRAFLESAEREFTRAQRYQRPCSVLMLDLDHFKDVNDTHGHAVGDTVLRECAEAWVELLRDQDVLGRLGGEEFCAVLPETASEKARQAAERMRGAISLLEFKGKDGPFRVTVSVGLTDVMQGDEHIAQVIERADRALYLAKQAGRNRVERVEGLRAVRTDQDDRTKRSKA
jgi:diguanylate cyclase (GGDEF)-like protein